MVADPTAKERRQYASAGWAMPDGSYYIRPGHPKDITNAIATVGYAVDNNGDLSEEQRNAVRRHIMKRATDLGKSDLIPNTWQADGTLKHAWPLARELTLMHAEDDGIEDFLEHFGVKGMHWGVRHARSHEELLAKAKEHEATAKSHAKEAERYRAEASDLEKNGVNSEAFKRVYGKFAGHEGEWEFYAKNGQSKAQALQQTHNNLRLVHNHYVRSANRHTKKAIKLRAQAEQVAPAQHSSDAEDALEHFGRKGMKWGQHVFGGNGSHYARTTKDPSKIEVRRGTSEDAGRAAELGLKVKSSGGTHVLSNKDLQDLVTRMNLEQQYSRLSSGDVKKGQTFVQKYNTHTQAGITAVKTTKEVAKIVGPLIVAGAAAAAARKASGHTGPVKMPRLAIGS